MTKHKYLRRLRRERWLNIKNEEKKGKNENKPKIYLKLKNYENRKRKALRALNKKSGHINHQKIDEHNKKIIYIEKHIDTEENIDNIVVLTNQINKFILKYIRFGFSINHKNIESISISGLLYMVGQISKLTHAKFHDGKHHIIFNEKYGLRDDMKIRHLFEQIGYWQYFGIKHAPYEIDKPTEENYFLSIRTSDEGKFDFLNDIKKFINKNVDLLQKDYLIEYRFDDAIKEAMGNSLEHAYPKDFNEVGRQNGKWWICGHYDKINQVIDLVFYDYGVGIRKSMKYNLGEDADIALVDRILDAKILKSDADLIEMAIDNGLSKYKNYLDHDRGKGFKRFKDFAKVSGLDCELTIISNSGRYKLSYNSVNNVEHVEKSKLSGDIDGMLIKWKIHLKGDEIK